MNFLQTVFYLQDQLAVKRGETITGTFTLAPNKQNERDQDISIHFKFEGAVGNSEATNHYKMC